MAEYIERQTTCGTSTSKRRARYPQSKYWIVTLNNPAKTDEVYREQFISGGAKFTFQRECGSNGTYHIQAFLWLASRRRRTAITELFGTGEKPHCEPCNDPKVQRSTAGKRRQETPAPTLTSKRRRLHVLDRAVERKLLRRVRQSVRELEWKLWMAQHSETYVKYFQCLVQLHAVFQPKRCFKSIVLWLYGEAGSGKSRCARQVARSAEGNGWTYYSKAGSNKWFDGYSGDHCLIWDDQTLLLQILDCYELQVETKGGYVNFNP